jgi:hypothetical protein
MRLCLWPEFFPIHLRCPEADSWHERGLSTDLAPVDLRVATPQNFEIGLLRRLTRALGAQIFESRNSVTLGTG